MTKVVNIRNDKYDVYCGRAGHGQDGYFGNPHVIGYCDMMQCHCNHTREESIAAYKIDFYHRIKYDPQFFLRILELKDKTLGCFCKQKSIEVPCHCDIIKEYLDKLNIDKPKYYAGIGSRETPIEISELMFKAASGLSQINYILRSGGADGADLAFEKGCDYTKGKKEIYIPWKGFNNSDSSLYNISQEAFDLASEIHPAWSRLSFGAKKLHARNCYQILGGDLKTPCDFVICWTKDGEPVGGTRTAIILAQKNNISVYNLAIKEDFERVIKLT